MKINLIKYSWLCCLTLGAFSAHASEEDFDFAVDWYNGTSKTVYLQIYNHHDGMYTCAQDIVTLGHNGGHNYWPDTYVDAVYGEISTNSSDIACVEPNDVGSGVLVTKATIDSQEIVQQGDFETSYWSTPVSGKPGQFFNVDEYNAPPPEPPATITTVIFNWNDIEANSSQMLSETISSLTKMLSAKYSEYEHMGSTISKDDSDDKHDISIKFHDTSQDP
jgi:hypothetical protein